MVENVNFDGKPDYINPEMTKFKNLLVWGWWVPGFQRAGFSLFREVVSRTPWSTSKESKGGSGWSVFKDNFSKAQCHSVLMCSRGQLGFIAAHDSHWSSAAMSFSGLTDLSTRVWRKLIAMPDRQGLSKGPLSKLNRIEWDIPEDANELVKCSISKIFKRL